MDRNEIIKDPFVVSFAGALLGLKAWPGTGWAEKAVNLVLGFLISIYTSPAIIEYLNASPRTGAAISFTCGATGLVLFASLIEGLRKTQWGSVIIGWLPGQRRNKE